jgi:hypothetical protein
MITPKLYTKLADSNLRRANVAAVKSVLASLPVPPGPDFAEFFENFVGPIGSERVGYQIIDLAEDEPSVLTATEQVQEQFDLPKRYLVISDLLADGVLIYDCTTDAVYDVDFEGTIDRLMQGALQPRWNSFSDFLSDFFSL